MDKQREDSFCSFEPFAKVLEWFNSQVIMEEVYRFPLLRLKPSPPPPLVIRGGRTGKQREKPRETQSTGSSRIWIPACAGMTESGIASIPQRKDDPPDCVAVYPILLQEAHSIGKSLAKSCKSSPKKKTPSRDRQSPDWRGCGSIRWVLLLLGCAFNPYRAGAGAGGQSGWQHSPSKSAQPTATLCVGIAVQKLAKGLLLLNRVAYGFLEVLRSGLISGLGFVLRPFPAPLPKSPDSRPQESVFGLECAKLIRMTTHRFFQRTSFLKVP